MADIQWYPSDKLHQYSYVKSLSRKNPQLYSEVTNLLASARLSMLGGVEPSLKKLEQLYKRERQKEEDLIKTLTKDVPNYNMPKEVGEYITTINQLFGIEKVFERNIKRIQAISQGSRVGKIDITSLFDTYLEKLLDPEKNPKFFTGRVTERDLKDLFYQAMMDMLGAIDDGIQAYSDIANELRSLDLKTRDVVLDDIFYLYFGKSLKDLSQDFDDMSQLSFEPSEIKMTEGKGFHGNVLEAVENLALRTIQKKLPKNIKSSLVGTGASGAKADNLFTIGIELTEQQTSLLTEASLPAKSSVRGQNIQRMETFYKSLVESKQQGYIVEISDKNYNLTASSFDTDGGFTAQRKFKLSNLKDTLEKSRVRHDRISDLIFILSNSGTGMINEKNYDEALHYLATLIAYILFDDIEIQNYIPTQTQAVHILNLDGVYIPLSVFLEATYQGFVALSAIPTNFVKLSFHEEAKDLKNINNNEIKTEQHWMQFREKRMAHSYIDIHFFRGFTDFITQHIKL